MPLDTLHQCHSTEHLISLPKPRGGGEPEFGSETVEAAEARITGQNTGAARGNQATRWGEFPSNRG